MKTFLNQVMKSIINIFRNHYKGFKLAVDLAQLDNFMFQIKLAQNNSCLFPSFILLVSSELGTHANVATDKPWCIPPEPLIL